ncbi:putative uncharacterized protein MED14OS [Nomascus leucogenys]|uniref:putative uncharacterized protein MED14OS n=1 Tax=Nomascus leucogenys TaxID=61853 RepID=UPI00122D8177|nr:putative uncharacterized protein MED14OS [Nomascus leucogenys]
MRSSSLPGARSPRRNGSGQSRHRLPPGRLRTGSRAPTAEARPHVARSPPTPGTGARGGGRRGGGKQGGPAEGKLRLRKRSEAASPDSRNVHVDCPRRKSIGRAERGPAEDLPTGWSDHAHGSSSQLHYECHIC